jgi:transposase
MGAEVIEIVERRRRWSIDDKLKVLTDALEPGASVSAVADRHGVSRNLVYTWLRLAREGRLRGLSFSSKTAPVFAPVQVVSEVPPAPAARLAPDMPRPAAPHRRRPVVVEITLANGRVVKVDESIDAQALARIVTALDGGGS